MLDESIATKGYVIHQTEESSLVDLSKIDFDALKVSPSFVHTVVGETLWEMCWGPDKAPHVRGNDMPPYQLLLIAFHITLAMEQSLLSQATEELRQQASDTVNELILQFIKKHSCSQSGNASD